MKKNIIKSIVSFALALVLAAGLMPVTADAAIPSELASEYGIHFGCVSVTCGGTSHTLREDNGATSSYLDFLDVDCDIMGDQTMEVDVEVTFTCPGCKTEEITVDGISKKSYNCTGVNGGTVTISESGHSLSFFYSRTSVEHNYSYTPDPGTEDTHVQKCRRCGEATSLPCSPSPEPATCLKAKTCLVCKRVFEEKLPHNYSYSVSGKTITETCDKGCGQNSQVTLMRNDEVSLSYTGSAIEALKTEVTGSTPVASTAITYTSNVNVGTAKGSITMGDVTVEETFEIYPATFDSDLVGDYTGAYDGQAHGITVGTLPADTKIEYKESTAEAYTETAVTRTGVGTTTVYYRLTNPNYVSKEGTATITVNRASISTENIRITPAVTNTYSGSALVPGVTVNFAPIGRLTEGTDYEVSWDKEGFIYPDDYRLTVTGKGNFTGTGNDIYVIKEATFTDVSVAQKNTLTYTGEAQAPEVTTAATTVDGAAVHFAYSRDDYLYYDEPPRFTEAGEYTVYFKVLADNHKTYKDTFTVVIDKAEPDFTRPSPKPGLVYDGTEQSLVTVTNAGDNEGEYVYRLDEESTWENDVTGKNAGDYTVYWKFTPVDANYATVEDSFTATIARAALPTDISFNYTEPALTYNGQERTVTVTLGTALSGVTAEHITLNYSDTPKNAGDYTFTISIAQSGNYEASTAPLTNDAWEFTINKAKPVIKWDPKEFTYNGAPQGEATVELIGSDTYTGKIQYYFALNENISREGLPTGAGTYVVYASTETTDNYEAEFEKETIRINPKAVTPTVVIEPEYFTYDGTAKEPAVKVMDGATEIPAKEYNVAYTGDTKQVGAATVTVSDKENGNYTVGTVSKVYLILPDASALDGVTTDNVNSSHQAAIDEIQAAMSGKNIDGASVIATGRWRSLVDRCARLETKLIAVDGAEDALDDAISNLPQQPKTSNLEEITEVLKQYEALEDNLTDAEKKALEEEIGQLEDLRAAMTLTNTNLKEVTDGSDALDEDELVFADKATIKDLQEKAENLQSNPYLTYDQVIALADSKEQLEKLEDKFAAAEKVEADYLNKLPAEADPDDEDAIKAYEAAKKAYADLGTAGKAKVDPKAVKKLEGLRTELTDYEIIKGSGAKWVKGSSKGLTFTANGYHPHFEGVEIDGKLIDDDYYTDKSGSTIVTLKASYLQKLKTGKHTITVLFGDDDYTGEAEGTFKVSYTADSPATGDSSNMILPVCLVIGSLLCLAVLVVNKKKFYQK